MRVRVYTFSVVKPEEIMMWVDVVGEQKVKREDRRENQKVVPAMR